MQKVDLFFFHAVDRVVISCFSEEKCLNYVSISKKKLGEELIERFNDLLNDLRLGRKDIASIYLISSFSTWNASRLFTLFVKTLSFFWKIPLFLKQESLDKENVDTTLKHFSSSKKNFKLIDFPEKVEPLYKKCPNMNI